MKIELELFLHDMDPFPHPDPRLAKEGWTGMGHTWWTMDRGSLGICSVCDREATWIRDTDDHPNYVWSDLYCGTHASEILRDATHLEARVVVQGLEFGYAWQAEITQNEEGANQ